jgi:hypothetical protein
LYYPDLVHDEVHNTFLKVVDGKIVCWFCRETSPAIDEMPFWEKLERLSVTPYAFSTSRNFNDGKVYLTRVFLGSSMIDTVCDFFALLKMRKVKNA